MWTWIWNLLVFMVPPGHTAFSLAPATHCERPTDACPGAVYSDFYEDWMRREAKEEGELRYATIAEAMGEEVSLAICRDAFGERIPDCKPYASTFTFPQAVAALATVATLESGFREDVMVGRGSAKKPSRDGGRGRGPSMEGCFIQAHPSEAWRWLEPTSKLRKAPPAHVREAVVQQLLGADIEAMRRCFRVGFRMLAHSHFYCLKNHPDQVKAHGWTFAMFSLYGTGNSCGSFNNGKTQLRVSLYSKFYDKAKEQWLIHLAKTKSTQT